MALREDPRAALQMEIDRGMREGVNNFTAYLFKERNKNKRLRDDPKTDSEAKKHYQAMQMAYKVLMNYAYQITQIHTDDSEEVS